VWNPLLSLSGDEEIRHAKLAGARQEVKGVVTHSGAERIPSPCSRGSDRERLRVQDAPERPCCPNSRPFSMTPTSAAISPAPDPAFTFSLCSRFGASGEWRRERRRPGRDEEHVQR